MTDYREMNDSEINRKVAAIVFPGDQNITPYSHRPDVQVFHKNDCNSMKDYCNNPADAWPIIHVSNIGLTPPITGHEWTCNYLDIDSYDANRDCFVEFSHSSDNPLRAAMIVFLMMKEKKI